MAQSNPNTTPHSRLIPVHTHPVEFTTVVSQITTLTSQAVALQTQVTEIFQNITTINNIISGGGTVGPAGPQGPAGSAGAVATTLTLLDQYGHGAGDVRELPTSTSDVQLPQVISLLQAVNELVALLIFQGGGDISRGQAEDSFARE